MADIAVFVDSRGGNTRKVAEAMAAELGVAVGDITAALPSDAKVLFLGSGTYGSRPGEQMQKFIASGSFAGRRVALFGTAASTAGNERMIAIMAEALKAKGATVIGSWHCPGRFLLVNRSRPNSEDLASAAAFARRMAGTN